MRLWHKDLIPVLPRQQLLGQWRECCAIAKNIAKKGTPNHILVNRIMDYPLSHFYTYGCLVWDEMNKRHYIGFLDKFTKYFDAKNSLFLDKKSIFPAWHNDTYMRQCYYNLQEKADCDGIDWDDWMEIHRFVSWRIYL